MSLLLNTFDERVGALISYYTQFISNKKFRELSIRFVLISVWYNTRK